VLTGQAGVCECTHSLVQPLPLFPSGSAKTLGDSLEQLHTPHLAHVVPDGIAAQVLVLQLLGRHLKQGVRGPLREPVG